MPTGELLRFLYAAVKQMNLIYIGDDIMMGDNFQENRHDILKGND